MLRNERFAKIGIPDSSAICFIFAVMLASVRFSVLLVFFVGLSLAFVGFDGSVFSSSKMKSEVSCGSVGAGEGFMPCSFLRLGRGQEPPSSSGVVGCGIVVSGSVVQRFIIAISNGSSMIGECFILVRAFSISSIAGRIFASSSGVSRWACSFSLRKPRNSWPNVRKSPPVWFMFWRIWRPVSVSFVRIACQKSSSVCDEAMPRLSLVAVSVILFSHSAAICSRSEMASRIPPSAFFAIRFRASSSALNFSALAISFNFSASFSMVNRWKMKLWQREVMVSGILWSSVVARRKKTCSGGSSSVLSSALNAPFESMWTSSMM